MKKNNCLAAYFQAQKGHFRTKIDRHLNSYKKKNEDTTFLVYLRTKKVSELKPRDPIEYLFLICPKTIAKTLRNKLNAFLE